MLVPNATHLHWNGSGETSWVFVEPTHDGGNIRGSFRSRNDRKKARRQRAGAAGNLSEGGDGNEALRSPVAGVPNLENKSTALPRLQLQPWSLQTEDCILLQFRFAELFCTFRCELKDRDGAAHCRSEYLPGNSLSFKGRPQHPNYLGVFLCLLIRRHRQFGPLRCNEYPTGTWFALDARDTCLNVAVVAQRGSGRVCAPGMQNSAALTDHLENLRMEPARLLFIHNVEPNGMDG